MSTYLLCRKLFSEKNKLSILAKQNFEQLTTTKLVNTNTPLALFLKKKKKYLMFLFSFDLQRKEFKKCVKHHFFFLFFFFFSIHKKRRVLGILYFFMPKKLKIKNYPKKNLMPYHKFLPHECLIDSNIYLLIFWYFFLKTWIDYG